MSGRNIQRVRTWKGRKREGKKERQGGGRLLVARAVRRSRRGEYSSKGEIYKKKKKQNKIVNIEQDLNSRPITR